MIAGADRGESDAARRVRRNQDPAVGHQQRRIAVREEAIARGDGMGIDAPDLVHPHQRRDQHHQRRFRQMEIGHQRIGHAKR
jgi:hypothetical protein